MDGIDMFAKGFWDDRDLVKGWNAQVKEYKKYHGMQTKNKQAPLSEKLTDAEIFELTDIADPDELEEMGISRDAQARAKASDEAKIQGQDAHIRYEGTASAAEADAAAHQPAKSQSAAQPPSAGPPAPGTAFVAAPGHEEALKNMQLAWYYAGYYQHQFEARLQPPQHSV